MARAKDLIELQEDSLFIAKAPLVHYLEGPAMNTSIIARAAALVSAVSVTFVLVQALATYALPAETAPLLAQATIAADAL